MKDPTSFKRLILLAVLHQVSPMVIRLLSVSDQIELPEFRQVMRWPWAGKAMSATSSGSTLKSSTAFAGRHGQ